MDPLIRVSKEAYSRGGRVHLAREPERAASSAGIVMALARSTLHGYG